MSGAGVSAASGIPTFRGPGGLWRTHRPEQLATPQAFRRDPSLVWEWYDWRRQQVAVCQPNRAHEVLAAWSRQYEGFTLITQNVDGLHERAGTADVVRFHGSIWELGCWDGCAKPPRRWRDETTPFPALPPPCPYCGGLTRPGVVWFGEGIDSEVISRSLEATDCDLFSDRRHVGARPPGRRTTSRGQDTRSLHRGGESRINPCVGPGRLDPARTGRASAGRGRRCSAPLPRLVPFERTRTASEGIEVIPNGLDLPHPVVVELLEGRAW